jgi:hypothetical protein
MPADIDLRLRRIRDCATLASVLKGAGDAERRWLGRQVANILAALPAAQAEVAAVSHRIDLREARELLRQVAMLESAVLELSHELPDSQGNARLALP